MRSKFTSCSRALNSPSVCSRMMTKSSLSCLVFTPGRLLIRTTFAKRSKSFLKLHSLFILKTQNGALIYSTRSLWASKQQYSSWAVSTNLIFMFNVCRMLPLKLTGVAIVPERQTFVLAIDSNISSTSRLWVCCTSLKTKRKKLQKFGEKQL